MTGRILLPACLALALGIAIPFGHPSASHAGKGAAIPVRAKGAASTSPDFRKRKPEHRGRRLSASSTILAFGPPPIQARAALLTDMSSGKLLYEKNADARLPIASTTKITTAALVLSHSRLRDIVRVSRKAASIGESTMVLRVGERVTVRQLLYGLMLNSGNDAAIALAEHVAGSEKRFVRMMNRLARDLGMSNTHYTTSHGLDAPHHFSSARDLATVAAYAMRDPTFRQIVATASYHILKTRHNDEHWLASINRVMYWFPGVDGIKPGNTDAAGFCQVVTAWRNGHHLLAVLLNTPTLVFDIRELLDYGAHDFRWVQAPAYWDSPDRSFTGGSGEHSWIYYVGAGHYVRGIFGAYFASHGGLRTLGYPRTEEIIEDGTRVQYFQGGKLAYDPTHHSVHPVDLGMQQASRFYRHGITVGRPQVASSMAGFYNYVGGRGVLGKPITGVSLLDRHPVQYFEYGAVVQLGGSSFLVPVGDAALRMRGWLPVRGASDSYPPSLARGVLSAFSPPPPPARQH